VRKYLIVAPENLAQSRSHRMPPTAALGTGCPVAEALVSPLVQIGADPAQKQQMGKQFPLVLSPAVAGVNFVALQEYFLARHDAILKAVSEYGAVMFTGFDVASGSEWASVLYKSGLKQCEYIGGAAVRKLVVGSEARMNDVQILTTNESPPESPIPFHHELAQTPNPPSHICFYCVAIDDEVTFVPAAHSRMFVCVCVCVCVCAHTHTHTHTHTQMPVNAHTLELSHRHTSLFSPTLIFSSQSKGATPIIRGDTIVEFLQERSPEFLEGLEKVGTTNSQKSSI
jgi:hypothetical protein